MNLRTTCGIVLRIVGHGESDKLVTFYSPDLGRVTGIAKGARKSKRRFVNKLEEFTLLQLDYRLPRRQTGLLLISEAEVLTAHLILRTDFRRYAAAMYICELLIRFTRDNDPDPKLFALLRWALASLHRAKNPLKIVLLAHLHLLEVAGYRPDLHRCASCRQAVVPGRNYQLQPVAGGLLCDLCTAGHGTHLPRMSIQTVSLLAGAQTLTLDRLDRLQFPRQVLVGAATALYHFSIHLLQQDLHAWTVLRALTTEGQTYPAAGRNGIGPSG